MSIRWWDVSNGVWLKGGRSFGDTFESAVS
jgi:hypothetical protein